METFYGGRPLDLRAIGGYIATDNGRSYAVGDKLECLNGELWSNVTQSPTTFYTVYLQWQSTVNDYSAYSEHLHTYYYVSITAPNPDHVRHAWGAVMTS